MKIKSIKPYKAFVKGGILSGFAYKFSSFGWLLGDIVSLLIMYFLWVAIYQNSPTELINGMTFHQMFSYLIFARVATTLVYASPAFWIIGEDIYEGAIAINLLRPLSYRYRILAVGLGSYISAFILMFLPLMSLAMVILYFVIGTSIPSFLSIILFIISSLLSFIIADALNFLIGEISIFTQALFGLMMIKNITLSFLSGSLLPSSFFPEWLRTILNFLPFQSMVEKPIMILMGQYDVRTILETFLIQIIWVIVLNILCSFTFNLIKKRVVSVGG